MIEMRWAWREVRVAGDQFDTTRVQVLQYRYRAPTLTSGINDFPPEKWDWSDWIDVPFDGSQP